MRETWRRCWSSVRDSSPTQALAYVRDSRRWIRIARWIEWRPGGASGVALRVGKYPDDVCGGESPSPSSLSDPIGRSLIYCPERFVQRAIPFGPSVNSPDVFNLAASRRGRLSVVRRRPFCARQIAKTRGFSPANAGKRVFMHIRRIGQVELPEWLIVFSACDEHDENCEGDVRPHCTASALRRGRSSSRWDHDRSRIALFPAYPAAAKFWRSSRTPRASAS